MARTENVIGSASLAAALAAGTNLVQLEELGGFQTFSSSSYQTGRSGSEILAPPVDAREYRLTWET